MYEIKSEGGEADRRFNFIQMKYMYMVSHLYFFATSNKERNSPYLQLSRRLNGKMLVLGFLYSKSTPIVQQKNAKKPICQTIALFAKY